MKRVRLTKLSDDRFNGNHPNGIGEGYVKSGEILKDPIVGEVFWVGFNWSTSTVTEVIDDATFKTLNSTYKIEYLD